MPDKDLLTPAQCDLETIAQIAHEAIRALCSAYEQEAQPPWHDAPDWMHEASFSGVEFRINNPGGTPHAQHQQWMDKKREDGWVYGAVKDSDAKTHPLLIPYEDLPEIEKRKDALLAAVVSAMMDPI